VAHHAPALVRRWPARRTSPLDPNGVIVTGGRTADVETVQATGSVAHSVRRLREEVLRSIRGIPDAVPLAVPSRFLKVALFPVDPVADHEDDAHTDPDDEHSGCCDDDDL